MAGYKKNMAQYENLEGWEKLSLGMQLDKWAIIKLTAPHDVMISHPEEVAKILLEN